MQPSETGLFSLIIMHFRSIRVVECTNNLLFFTDAWYSVVWMYHSLTIDLMKNILVVSSF